MRLRCCLGVAYFLAKSEPVLLIKVLLIKKACTAYGKGLSKRETTPKMVRNYIGGLRKVVCEG